MEVAIVLTRDDRLTPDPGLDLHCTAPTLRLVREADLPGTALALWRATEGIGISRTSDHLPELAVFLLLTRPRRSPSVTTRN